MPTFVLTIVIAPHMDLSRVNDDIRRQVAEIIAKEIKPGIPYVVSHTVEFVPRNPLAAGDERFDRKEVRLKIEEVRR